MNLYGLRKSFLTLSHEKKKELILKIRENRLKKIIRKSKSVKKKIKDSKMLNKITPEIAKKLLGMLE
jgi:hypothetical protein